MELIRKDCKLAAVTRSEKGSVIVSRRPDGSVAAIEIERLVDTTGAGDLYAAGFLFGYTKGRGLADCGRLGSLAAGLVIQQIGPRPRQNLREEAREGGAVVAALSLTECPPAVDRAGSCRAERSSRSGWRRREWQRDQESGRRRTQVAAPARSQSVKAAAPAIAAVT